jgi:uncharacterized protein YdaU (DUF1376 family)
MARGAIRIDWYPSDALGGMTFLTVLEELAYRRIIDLLYVSCGELPDDDAVLAEATRTFADWPAVRAGLLKKGKIDIAGGALTNARCTEILNHVAEKSEKARASGQASGRKRRQILPERPRDERSTNSATDVAANGATNAPTDGELSQGVRESVRETDVSLTAREGFADFAAAYPKPDAVMAAGPVWARLMNAGTDAGEIMAGLERWKAHWRARIDDPKDDFQLRHIRSAPRWLEEGGWRDPDPGPVAPPRAAARAWPGPAHVRATVVAHAGEDFARSYLDPAGWDGASIVAATATAAGKLRRLPALSAHLIRTSKEMRS